MHIMVRILLAEDNEVLQKLYSAVLESAFGDKIKLDIVKNGMLAVEKVKQGNKYDLIVLDVEMPLMDGIRASLQIKAIGFPNKIIGHTSMRFKEASKVMLQGNMDGFMQKGLGAEALVDFVKRNM